MIKLIRKFSCWLLAGLLCVGALTGCAHTNKPNPSTSDSTDATISGEETTTGGNAKKELRYDAAGYLMDEVEGVDFGNREVRIMVGTTMAAEYNVDATDIGTPVNFAVFSRNKTVEKRLNCSLQFIPEADGYYNRNSFANAASTKIIGGEIDMIAVYGMTASVMMVQGLLANLNDSPYLDFDEPWWNQNMVDSCSIYDKMYYCTGDISYYLTGAAFAFLYNKDLGANSLVDSLVQREWGEETIYDLVDSGKWTFDKMATIAKAVAIDNDGVKDESDTYGYISYSEGPDAFYTAAGLKLLEKGADGSIMISDDMGSQRAESVANDVIEFLKSSAVASHGSIGAANADAVYDHCWWGGRGLFFNVPVNTIRTERDFRQGLLPVPKYDDSVDGYYTHPGNGFSLWCIPHGFETEKFNEVTAVMEVLASESYRKVTSAYYEVTLGYRQDSEDDYKMLQTIHDGVVIDGGRVVTQPFNDNTWACWRDVIRKGRDYLAYYNGLEKTLQEQAVTLNRMILQMDTLY